MARTLHKLRALAHAAFDPLWESGACTRGTAYKILAAVMELPLDDAHIGMFTKDQCYKVIAKVKGKRPEDFAKLLRTSRNLNSRDAA